MVTNASKREKQPFNFTKKNFQKPIKSESVSKCSRHTFILIILQIIHIPDSAQAPHPYSAVFLLKE